MDYTIPAPQDPREAAEWQRGRARYDAERKQVMDARREASEGMALFRLAD